MDKIIAKDRWLTSMEVLRMSGSQAKSSSALIDKTSAHYDPLFPGHVRGKWRGSEVQKYLAVRSRVGEK